MSFNYACQKDSFDDYVAEYFLLKNMPAPTVHKGMLSIVYNRVRPECSIILAKKGVYAFYIDNVKLMKIGKATKKKRGMRHRFGLYWSYMDKVKMNFDNIQVKYVYVDSSEEAWALERYISGKAYASGENMDWENKTSN